MVFPALHQLAKAGRLDVPSVGVARPPWTIEQLRARARDGVEKHGGGVDRTAFDTWGPAEADRISRTSPKSGVAVA